MSSEDQIYFPEIYDISRDKAYDDFTERKQIIEIPCSRDGIQNLNTDQCQLLFHCDGSYLYNLNSYFTGFMCRVVFLPALGSNPEMVANVTLASNFFGYLFSRMALRIKNVEVENIINPGIVMDIFYHFETSDFRNNHGEILTFIPDTSMEANSNNSRTPTYLAGVVGDAAGIVATLSNKELVPNPSFNE